VRDLVKMQLHDLTENVVPFSLSIKDSGVFRNIQDPRVIWLGIEPSESLEALYREIETSLSAIGFQKESRMFRPHLTIGRIKFLKNRDQLIRLIEHNKNREFLTFTVSELLYYESILNANGAVYKVLGRYPFKSG